MQGSHLYQNAMSSFHFEIPHKQGEVVVGILILCLCLWLLCLCVDSNYKIQNTGLGTHNVTGENFVVWVDKEMLNVMSIFAGKGGFDHAFTEAGPSLN